PPPKMSSSRTNTIRAATISVVHLLFLIGGPSRLTKKPARRRDYSFPARWGRWPREKAPGPMGPAFAGTRTPIRKELSDGANRLPPHHVDEGDQDDRADQRDDERDDQAGRRRAKDQREDKAPDE